jgi:type IV pilus assembly protein PilY1
MIMLSIETPMQGAMYPDVTCTGNPATDSPAYGCSPSACRTTSGGRNISNCYTNTVTYDGYFNAEKCYTYTGSGSSGRFEVSGNASSHQCSSKWSGNFLNWATMTAMDGFRRTLTGGNRDTDSAGTTILLGARQTLGTGDSWFPEKRIDSAGLYTPFSGTKYLVRHANGFSVCSASDCTVHDSGSGQTRFPDTTSTTHVDAAYNLRVKVCDTTAGLEGNCNTTSNKPEGLLQKYAGLMRFGLTSYAIQGNPNIDRDGGVIRSNMKWIANKVPYGLKYHNSGGTVVDCTDTSGCTNPEAEMNADGTFVNNPDGIVGGNSGVINYVNKFGYSNGYKTYDPISEMYYEIVRYFKNLGPSTNNYCSGLSGTTDDGFTYFCPSSGRSWRDPYIYPCQAGVVVAINDANPWCDKRVPGTAWTGATGGPSCTNDYGEPSNANTFTDATTGTAINTTTWTNKVGNYEFGPSITMNIGCVQGGACDWSNTSKTFTDLGRASGTAPYAPKQNSYYIAGLAYYAHTHDLRSDLAGTQALSTYMIDTQESNSTMLVGKKSMLFLAAKYGGFSNINGTNGSGDMVPDLTSEWDKDGDGFPDNYLLASSNPAQIQQGLSKFFLDIMNRAASGTAASVLASSEGSGANILQAVFYPKRPFGSQEVAWTGEMQNLWYYVDPFLQNSNIREDTDTDRVLDLVNDNVIQFYFDSTDNQVKVNRYQDSDGSGSPDTFIGTNKLEDIKNLWEVGSILFQRDLGTSPRTIYTTVNGTSFLSGGFSTSNASALRTYLQASDDTEAQKIIQYVHGIDQSGYRSRTVTIGATTAVWKLGDIINSTPRTASSVPLNTYHLQPPSGYLDATYSAFIGQSSYRNRSMSFVGGNDGLLHAFKRGVLEEQWSGQTTTQKGRLTGSELGKEMWAFIPKNTLPYLKYMADPNYCHLFYIDAAAMLVDASVEGAATSTKTVNSWKTILIGASGLGGGCRNAGDSCTDCVKTPITNVGYSSYFALDVTDPENPSLLWEFSDPTLGFSTSGPGIVRIGDPQKNGSWFVVFASGPTGPVDTSYHQFLGKSDQNLRLFVLDLKTGSLLRTIDTGIQYAFGGSLYNATLDTERGAPQSAGHYSDDVFYLGYTKKTGTTWTDGGVLRVLTRENSDPAQWSSSMVLDSIGPVTSAISKLQDRRQHKLWLYFGTGRFFYKLGTTLDDPDGQRTVYGIKEPCYTGSDDINNSCSDAVSTGALVNQTTSPSATISASASGWFVNLDASGTNYKAERVITDPLAVFSGIVFFTTFAPNADACAFGGNTYIWALNYSAGNSPSNLYGKAILQVSTGEIKEFNLGSAFTEKDGRRTAAISGVPPKGQGLSILVGPRPLRKVLHIQEK